MISYKLQNNCIDDNPTELFLDGLNSQVILKDNVSYQFSLRIIAKANNNEKIKIWKISGTVSTELTMTYKEDINPLTKGEVDDWNYSVLTEQNTKALRIFVTAETGVELTACLELYPTPEYVECNQSYQNYLDAIASKIQDDAQKLSITDIDKILKDAVVKFGIDKDFALRKKISGNGTNKYILAIELADLWTWGYSEIISIEYPAGGEPKIILDKNEYEIYDDGTKQDGSNVILRFLNVSPRTDEHFIIELTVEPKLYNYGTQNFPNTEYNFSAITNLAASMACRELAAKYAQSIDATINADVVNYNDKSAKYTSLAKEYFKQYNLLVFGSEEPTSSVEASYEIKELDSTFSDFTPYLFHRQK